MIGLYRFFILLLIFFLLPTSERQLCAQEMAKPEKVWLFSYFTNNGEDGLHLAWSSDALIWKPLKEGKSFLEPPKNVGKLIRDPSILQGPDGTFHFVWTGSWTGRSIGYASSKDLVNWTDKRPLHVMEHESSTRNAWAPELFYDNEDQTFYIIWASTIPDRFPETISSSETDYNHRLYYTATKDFKTFAQTKLYWDPKHNVIDSFLIKDGKRYFLFYKDETLKPEVKKNILFAAASSPTGPFDVESVISHTNWVEGPTVLKNGDEWFVYYDCYTKKHFGAIRSKDLKTWENITDKICFPSNARHGTTFEIDSETLKKLIEVRP